MIIFAADLHQTPRAWTNRWSIEGDAFYSLDQLTQYAEAHKDSCDGLVLGGDTTDSNTPDAATLHYVSEFMRRMREADIPVYYINGQHDKGAYGYSLLETYGGIHIDQRLTEIGGFQFYGLSYRSRAELLEALAETPECDYLVLHCAFKHLLGFEGAWQLEASDVPEYIPNVLVGDIHIKDVSTFGKTTIYSTGAAYACNSAEIAQKHGFFTIDNRGLEYHEYATRAFHQLTVKDSSRDAIMAEIDKINKAANKAKLPPVVFLKKKQEIEMSFDKFDKTIIVVLDEALELVDVSDLHIDAVTSLNLKASLPAVVDRKTQVPLYSFMESLLDAPDPREYVAGWLKEKKIVTLEN